MIKAGIIGGSGYTGGELIRLLIQHPQAEISYIYSRTRPGKEITSAHPDLLGMSNLCFTSEVSEDIDVLFLCLGHGHSRKFLEEHSFGKKTKIIDLSQDFRLLPNNYLNGESFQYGLPELYKEKISNARYIANPGCFATAIQLALLPLANTGLLGNEVHINATTGSTGAGISPSATTHFSWRNNNQSWYKPFTHQHLGEIEQSIHSLQPQIGKLLFIPQRGNFARGIFASAYTRCQQNSEEAYTLYRDFYKGAPFTHISSEPIHLKQVVNTNQCHIQLHKHGDILLVTVALDNLLKGASGQAVQNMNLMMGFEETEGLKLKAGVY